MERATPARSRGLGRRGPTAAARCGGRTEKREKERKQKKRERKKEEDKGEFKRREGDDDENAKQSDKESMQEQGTIL